MKGLLVSLVTLILYAASTMVVARLWHPRRNIYLFVSVGLAWIVGYAILYFATPANLYFLPKGWMCSNIWLDFFYGLIVFLLNCHTFVDCAVTACAGFSISLVVVILKAAGQTATTDELVAKYQLDGETDRIYGWRVPHLERRGYIRRDPKTGRYLLTPKGHIIAATTFFLKRILNLGEGG
jgi:hypothetical protein